MLAKTSRYWESLGFSSDEKFTKYETQYLDCGEFRLYRFCTVENLFQKLVATHGSGKHRRMRPARFPTGKTRDSGGHSMSNYNYHTPCPRTRATPLR